MPSPSFDPKSFAVQLIAESLFYDEEYGAIGNLSLVEPKSAKEMYIAYYVPEEQKYMVDEATAWEPFDEVENADIGYAFASETIEHASTQSVEELAQILLSLAETRGLSPSMAILFEDDELP